MPLSIDFAGKLVLVTGGGRGIGLAITEAIAEGSSRLTFPSVYNNDLDLLMLIITLVAGADIAITYTSTDATQTAESISQKFGVQVKAFKCNVNSSSEVDKTVEDVQKAFGKEIDIGINNAGEHTTDAVGEGLHVARMLKCLVGYKVSPSGSRLLI
jgi:sorbose reductase